MPKTCFRPWAKFINTKSPKQNGAYTSYIFAAVMQAPTHILAGVIINRLFKWRNYKLVGLLLTFICCMFAHAFFDQLALSVYRQPEPQFNDPFWLIYHLAMWLGSIVLLYIFWRDYKWGIIFSLIPEFDWLVLGIQHVFHFDIPFYQMPWIHFSLNYILVQIPPFNYMDMLPDNRNNPWACIWELLLIAVLAFAFRAMVRYRKNIHF